MTVPNSLAYSLARDTYRGALLGAFVGGGLALALQVDANRISQTAHSAATPFLPEETSPFEYTTKFALLGAALGGGVGATGALVSSLVSRVAARFFVPSGQEPV